MQDRHAIIHIGTWKTGSTSIQGQLAKRRAELLRQGACLPLSPGQRTCVLLMFHALGSTFYAREAPCWEGMEPERRLERFGREFADEMAQLPATVDRVIFSDERMSESMRSVAEVQRLRDFLSAWFTRFLVVLYVRRQDLFMASLYVQMLRAGYVGSPFDLQVIGRVRLQGNYHRVVSLWSEVFGADSIQLRIYESGEKPYDSVHDFFTLCGLRPPVDQQKAMRRNTSVDLVGQEILRNLGPMLFRQDVDLHVVSGQWDRLIRLVEKRHPGKGWLPTRSEAAALVAQFADGNEALRQRYYPERASLFSEDYSNLPEAIERPSDQVVLAGVYAVLADAVAQDTTPGSMFRSGIADHRSRPQQAAPADPLQALAKARPR